MQKNSKIPQSNSYFTIRRNHCLMKNKKKIKKIRTLPPHCMVTEMGPKRSGLGIIIKDVKEPL